MSQHQVNVTTQELQCRDIRINLQQCIPMSRHHHDMDSTLENEKFQIYFFDVVTLTTTHDIDNYDVVTSSQHHQTAASRVAILGVLKYVILASFLGSKT